MKALSVLPNFTILGEVKHENYMSNLYPPLIRYCEIEANVEHVDSFKITPESYWRGRNIAPEFDFITILKENSNGDIPENVLIDLEKLNKRFGVISQVGDDCLKVRSVDLMTEIKNNTKLQEIIYAYDDDLIFFSGDINLLQSILCNDLFCPIQFHSSKMITYILQGDYGNFIIKAINPLHALKSLYGKHKIINEKTLRERLAYRKNEITTEAINEFIELVFEDIKKELVMFKVPSSTSREPFEL